MPAIVRHDETGLKYPQAVLPQDDYLLNFPRILPFLTYILFKTKPVD